MLISASHDAEVFTVQSVFLGRTSGKFYSPFLCCVPYIDGVVSMMSHSDACNFPRFSVNWIDCAAELLRACVSQLTIVKSHKEFFSAVYNASFHVWMNWVWTHRQECCFVCPGIRLPIRPLLFVSLADQCGWIHLETVCNVFVD